MQKAKVSILRRASAKRWYARIDLPADVGVGAGFESQQLFSVENVDRTIVLSLDKCGELRLPKITGKRNPVFSVELSAATLALRPLKRQRFNVELEVVGNRVSFKLPESYKDDASAPLVEKPARKRAADGCPDKAAYLRKNLGQSPFASVVVDGAKCGLNVIPLKVDDMVGYMQSLGLELCRLGPKLFRLEGRTVNFSDLQDEFNRIFVNENIDNTVLVLE